MFRRSEKNPPPFLVSMANVFYSSNHACWDFIARWDSPHCWFRPFFVGSFRNVTISRGSPTTRISGQLRPDRKSRVFETIRHIVPVLWCAWRVESIDIMNFMFAAHFLVICCSCCDPGRVLRWCSSATQQDEKMSSNHAFDAFQRLHSPMQAGMWCAMLQKHNAVQRPMSWWAYIFAGGRLANAEVKNRGNVIYFEFSDRWHILTYRTTFELGFASAID